MDPTGRQVLIDFWQCNEGALRDLEALESALRSAAEATQAAVVDSIFTAFSDGRVAGALIISEGHVSIHSWPEERHAAVDVYTCGEGLPGPAIGVLSRALGSDTFSVAIIGRGLPRRVPSISVAEVYSERAAAPSKDEG